MWNHNQIDPTQSDQNKIYYDQSDQIGQHQCDQNQSEQNQSDQNQNYQIHIIKVYKIGLIKVFKSTHFSLDLFQQK